MAHATMEKFGYPDSLIKEYKHWTVQLRPKQPTLGSLVLICKEDATAFGEISADAFAEKKTVIADIEATLQGLFGYNKINYLMLMMVDPQVHYHVIPRYESDKTFSGVTFQDTGWPGPPNIGFKNELDNDGMAALLTQIKNAWPS